MCEHTYPKRFKVVRSPGGCSTKETATRKSRAQFSAHFPVLSCELSASPVRSRENTPRPAGRLACANSSATPINRAAAVSKLKNVDLLDLCSLFLSLSVSLHSFPLSLYLPLAALRRLHAIDNECFAECYRPCFDTLCTRWSRRVRFFFFFFFFEKRTDTLRKE